MGGEGRSERWNKCVRFERQWAEHALKEMPLPPSLLPCTHNQMHTNRNTLALHRQHSMEPAFSESNWTANGEREDGWTRRNQTGSMLQHHREHVLTEPHNTSMPLDYFRTGSSTVHTTARKERSFLVTEDKSKGVRLASKELYWEWLQAWQRVESQGSIPYTSCTLLTLTACKLGSSGDHKYIFVMMLDEEDLRSWSSLQQVLPQTWTLITGVETTDLTDCAFMIIADVDGEYLFKSKTGWTTAAKVWTTTARF